MGMAIEPVGYENLYLFSLCTLDMNPKFCVDTPSESA